MATTDPFAPAKEVQKLARIADAASTKVFGYILDHPGDPDLDLWRRLMRDLDRAAAQLDTQALQLMGALNGQALSAIQAATAVAEAYTKQTADVRKGLKVFAGILNLAGALVGGAGLGTIVDAAKAVRDAAKGEAENTEGAADKGKDAAKPGVAGAAKPPKI